MHRSRERMRQFVHFVQLEGRGKHMGANLNSRAELGGPAEWLPLGSPGPDVLTVGVEEVDGTAGALPPPSRGGTAGGEQRIGGADLVRALVLPPPQPSFPHSRYVISPRDRWCRAWNGNAGARKSVDMWFK